jgi:hypothetical protein
MAEKGNIEALLKEKLAQLESKNPSLSEEEAKRQKAELKAEMVEADKIFKAEGVTLAEKIKQMQELLAVKV